jgi:hydrogenase maturation protease
MNVLVAGVGNVFLGDDGFGVEVVRRLAERPLPDGVHLADYGIRGMHLAYDLAGGAYDTTILIDAVATGEPPGTVSVIELDPAAAPAAELLDAHGMQPDVVLGLVALLGEHPGKVLLVGCEPAVIDHGMELSPPVAQAVGAAVDTTIELLAARQVGG